MGERPSTSGKQVVAGSASSRASSPATRKSMQGNRRRDTEPEIGVRRLLHARGLRFRVDFPPIPGLRRRADIAFPGRRLAIFIDGCFWHSCPVHGSVPSSNREFWLEKFARNRARDEDTDRRLRARGWTVERLWTHEDVRTVADAITKLVGTSPVRPPNGGEAGPTDCR